MNIKDVYDWLETAGQEPQEPKVDLAIKLISEELEELVYAWTTGNNTEFLDAIVDLYWVTTNAAYFAGYTLEQLKEYAEKVSVSNWSKLCTNEVMALETVKAYTEGTHWDKPGVKIECYYEQVGLWWIVKRTDGKILKSLNYSSVDKL